MSFSDDSASVVSRDNETLSNILAYIPNNPSRWQPKKKSPYVDTSEGMAKLAVGPDKKPYNIHRCILRQNAVLNTLSLLDWDTEPVPIPDLDDDTAHTLVHFLYTGRWEVLQPADAPSTTSDANAAAAHAFSTRVYAAAVRYALPGLADLAREHMTTLDKQLSLSTLLATARDHGFPALPHGDAWFEGYIVDAIQRAIEADSSLPWDPEFRALVVGNSALLDVAWNTMLGGQAAKAAALEDRRSNDGTGRAAEPVYSVDDAVGDAVSVDDAVEDAVSLADSVPRGGLASPPLTPLWRADSAVQVDDAPAVREDDTPRAWRPASPVVSKVAVKPVLTKREKRRLEKKGMVLLPMGV